MVVWDDLHGLFDLLVAFILQTLTIPILAGIDTSTEVVVLWRRRWGSGMSAVSRASSCRDMEQILPITIGRDDIVDPEFLADLLDTQVKGVSFELFICHVGHDHSGQSHKPSSFILLGISPSVSLLTSPYSVCLDRVSYTNG